MLTLALIGLIGGLVTGISPCILPVLPVIFFTGAQTAQQTGQPARAAAAQGEQTGAVATAERPVETKPSRGRPYLVILGLVVSFTLVTLFGSLLLSILGLPQDVLRWAGLVVLALIGIGLIVPRFEHLLEKPFSWIPQRSPDSKRGGFPLGLALGAVYVPCAGPVLAAITVAGSTGQVGVDTVVLTVTFAVGAAIPLLVFALAGRRVAERVRSFRKRQRGIRVTAGIVMIALAVGPGVQPAAAAAAGGAGLHQRAAGEGEQLRAGEGRAEPGRAGERPEQGPGQVHRRRGRAGELRHGAGHQGHPAVVQHARQQRGRPEVVARQGRADRLLGLLVHQLPALDPARDRLGQGLPRRRPRGDRGARPGVRVREGTPQRRVRRRELRHHLPGRAGQLAGHLDELPQPVLARALPDRRAGHRAAHQVRRGRLRRHREADPPAAARRRLRRQPARADRHRRRHPGHRRHHPRDLPRVHETGELRRHRKLHRRRQVVRPARRPGQGHLRARRRLAAHPAEHHPHRRHGAGAAQLPRQGGPDGPVRPGHRHLPGERPDQDHPRVRHPELLPTPVHTRHQGGHASP